MILGLPSGSVDKESTSDARDARDEGLIPGWKRSLGEGNGNPLQYSYLENPKDRGAWRATVRGVAESDVTEHLLMLLLGMWPRTQKEEKIFK